LQLKNALKNIDIIKIEGKACIAIKGVTSDSRAIKKDFAFAAIKGNKQDGRKFISDAIKNGANCIVTDDTGNSAPSDITRIFVKDLRPAYAQLCSNFHNDPTKKLKVIGITGTNGKTTTLYLLEAILKKAGYACGRIGTIDYSLGTHTVSAPNTTPDAGLLQRMFADMLDKKLDYCVMEVSSHALHQERVRAIHFNGAIFTNLSKEHLDYHKTMDEYFICKKKLFEQLQDSKYGVTNIDDAYGKKLAKGINAKMITYGFSKQASVRVLQKQISTEGSAFILATPKGKINIETSLIGLYNIYNATAAISAALQEGISPQTIKAAVKEFNAPAGRLQLIEPASPAGKPSCGIYVYVDYAHTDDALEKVLSCLSQLKRKKIITVFGCGGDRDTAKRPRMAKVASEISDFVIITSDNPRSEDPMDIISQIKKGLPKGFKNYLAIEDRKAAIEKAIEIASEEDIVLLAGKGHETYQILKNRKIHHDDREIARLALNKKCLV